MGGEEEKEKGKEKERKRERTRIIWFCSFFSLIFFSFSNVFAYVIFIIIVVVVVAFRKSHFRLFVCLFLMKKIVLFFDRFWEI